MASIYIKDLPKTGIKRSCWCIDISLASCQCDFSFTWPLIVLEFLDSSNTDHVGQENSSLFWKTKIFCYINNSETPIICFINISINIFCQTLLICVIFFEDNYVGIFIYFQLILLRLYNKETKLLFLFQLVKLKYKYFCLAKYVNKYDL